jgi:predicted nuclease with TOPRIM domain
MEQNKYLKRELLLQIKRNWSENEIISLLMKENKSLKFHIGELKSELDELKDKYKNRNEEYKKDDYVKSLLEEIARHREKRTNIKDKSPNGETNILVKNDKKNGKYFDMPKVFDIINNITIKLIGIINHDT